MIGAKQDVTPRMKAIEEIEKLSFVASHTDNAIAITNAHFKIEWSNQAFSKVFGYTAREVIGKEPDGFIGPETDPAVCEAIRTKIRSGESVAAEIAFIQLIKGNIGSTST